MPGKIKNLSPWSYPDAAAAGAAAGAAAAAAAGAAAAASAAAMDATTTDVVVKLNKTFWTLNGKIFKR